MKLIMAISKTEKNDIIKKYATHEGDTGSTEVQVALLTTDINNLTDHMKNHSHDHHSYVGLLKKIGHRRNLLRYLKDNDINRYRDLIKRLGLRR
ncbi:30S ribosomal protein S15 [Lactobacillus acetotolerans DSM 20749 = JCM 3825]|nr:30S ribosomal protein S15 [Lactobacillus acetotolerans DSM 20749 = JCM 3825]